MENILLRRFVSFFSGLVVNAPVFALWGWIFRLA